MKQSNLCFELVAVMREPIDIPEFNTLPHPIFTAFIRGDMNNSNLLSPTNNDIKRGFVRSDQWKELLNITKPLYYMNAKVMSKIGVRNTQQGAYTRQMMLFQPMSNVYICTSDKLRLLIIKYTTMDGRKRVTRFYKVALYSPYSRAIFRASSQ